MSCVDTTQREEGVIYCNFHNEKYSCWPSTVAGSYAMVPCPEIGKSIVTRNASKYCSLNGTWEEKANYTYCFDNEDLYMSKKFEVLTQVLYDAGFGISTVALFVALFIFLYFRSLRCLRNRIHCHLIVSFILKNVVFFIRSYTITDLAFLTNYSWVCKLTSTLGNYAILTNFFWMLVEGLYLHIIIVWTYTADKMKLWYFIIIGWVTPAVILIIWAAVRLHHDTDNVVATVACWAAKINSKQYQYLENLDKIYLIPTYIVLVVNTLVLISIIKVLVTKLRATHTMETDQVRKSVKATLLLFPILGLTYILFLWSPEDPTAVLAHSLTNALLEPFQGFFVALLYCFLNREVRTVLKKFVQRLQEFRSLSSANARSSIFSNDSRKESLRIESGRSSIDHCTGGTDHRNGLNGHIHNVDHNDDHTDEESTMLHSV